MGRAHGDVGTGPHAAPAPDLLPRRDDQVVDDLQRRLGNTGVQRLAQRLREADAGAGGGGAGAGGGAPEPDQLSPSMAQQLARRLRDAMEGWGTDEDAIYGVFTGRTQSQVDAIERAYGALFDRDLTADLHDELNAGELRRLAALAPQEPSPAAGAAGGGLAAAAERVNRAEPAARRLRAAMEGLGTDEDAIFAVLTGRSAAERQEIRDTYARIYSRSLETDLRDEMSGAELTEAMRLLGQGELSAADELHQAITGLGTDEGRIMRVLEQVGASPAAVTALLAEHQRKYGSLLVALEDDLSGGELDRARDLLGRAGDEAACFEVLNGADPDLLHQVADFGFATTAERLRLVGRVHTETVVGDDDEGVLERIWLAPDMAEPAAQNQALYRTSRSRGAEIPESLSTFGRFENRFEQDMFEGVTTVGHGLFDWTLVGDRLDVRVPIDFEPASGVTPPYALWQTQINNTWNQFAVREPGGRRIPIQFTMVNDSNASREVEVVENKIPGQISPEDRANAGKFYVMMRPSTVPHEFGHFIGLPDEYQRSHDDFRQITGAVPTGPANTSGQTNAQIADDLHTALHADPQAQRRIQARALLTTVGLLVGGIPQQGDFAQAVLAEYDSRHGSLEDDLVDQLDQDADRGDRWVLQTVFSYASRSVMGNPEVFGPAPHTHPVEPRHLREFVAIVQRRFPGENWSIGAR
ncbi:MAG: hypothetical protein QNJ12_03415 [Ilumatobacter sp.]|uniref:hypothetical protein n=1 Tax=Ilumatobacter sp. TaxID=1967498 RepID=UPI0026277DAE|nr:hypothetical protein [Ilumatobacter sp.]MDJ0767810.1 hypothetical protein [Ilumatobacter sp.]